jgi:glycerate kinase
MAQALGVRFDGAPTPIAGGDLERVRAIDRTRIDPRIAACEIVALADVDSPLLGASGATALFAPQKGAAPDRLTALERGLERLASFVPEIDVRAPGSGAAGGLGFGLVAFAGATLVPGAERVLDAAGFDARLARASCVITSEGRLDAQSLRGKLVIAVARRARRCGVRAIALVGSTGEGIERARQEGLDAWYSLAERFGSERALGETAAALSELAAEIAPSL